MTALPSKSSMLAIPDQGVAKTIFGALWDFLTGLFGSDGTAATALSTLGAEPTANKATSFGTVNDILFPTVQAVKTYADSLVIGLLDDRGDYNASGNAWPSSGGSGTAGAIMKGDVWRISVAGALGGSAVSVGDLIRALVDSPGSTASNWSIMDGASSLPGLTHAATSKATPVDADELPLVDSAASFVLKKLTLANLWGYISAKLLSAANAFTAVQYASPVAQTDGATVTWAVNTTQSATLAAGGSRTITTSGTPPAGATYLLTVTPTGAYTQSFDAAKFKGLSGITQTATSGKTDCWVFRSDGTYLDCIGFRADIGS